MQRAEEAQKAKTKLIGMSSEEIFSCMGIPSKKGKVGDTEIWLYKSGDGWSMKHKKSVKTTVSGAIENAFTLGDEFYHRRFCNVSIVMMNNRVAKVNYNGPTGGFMTEDEQCAYAVKNCLE